jgi:hypothetical protein
VPPEYGAQVEAEAEAVAGLIRCCEGASRSNQTAECNRSSASGGEGRQYGLRQRPPRHNAEYSDSNAATSGEQEDQGAAIAAIGESAWTPITYPQAIWDEDQQRLISDAEVAEVRYTAFASKKGQAITARLIVRRVRDLNRKAAGGQDELFAIWRYHALFTDSPFEMIQAEAQHRDHAIVEQVFADLVCGPLAHLPSGHFPANAAWLTLAAICHNLTRTAGCLAGAFHAKARGSTIRGQLIAVAARIARHGRGHITMHLPQGWHRETEWLNLFQAACGPPAAAA